jgi:hypothetical protein
MCIEEISGIEYNWNGYYEIANISDISYLCFYHLKVGVNQTAI